MRAADAVLRAPYETRRETRADLLLLDRNEGPAPPGALLDAVAAAGTDLLRRYPDARWLESLLAERLALDPDRVLVTAGADDAIDRCCRATLGPGRSFLYAAPTFQMLERYAALAGGELDVVPWTDAFPLEALLGRINDATALVAIVSPNNPTGSVIGADALRRIATASQAMVLLDHAYVEYADQDLTPVALELPNVVVARTLSKAWGLAGCRVGYAVGTPEVITTLRAAGAPYPVAGPSLALAAARLRDGADQVRAHVQQVRAERDRLTDLLSDLDVWFYPSQASFVLARFGERASFVREALLARRILVRDFSRRAGLEGTLRISLPGNEGDFRRLTSALELILAPQAILFDLDGVLADVRESYDACIARTAESFGVRVTPADIGAAKRAGDASNDWVITRRLVAAGGVDVSLEQVTSRFQANYLGDQRPGLRERERLLLGRDRLERLARRFRLAIVTGRPREEALWFLQREGIAGCFTTMVAMKDAPPKPAADPVRKALEQLGLRRAWMLGDSPDDMRAARAAEVLPIGVRAPGAEATSWNGVLRDAGAAWVLHDAAGIEELLP